MSLSKARLLASEIKQILEGACERIEVAGSIRRGKQEVKDIELVAVPKFQDRLKLTQGTLDNWGSGKRIKVNLLDELIKFYIENPELSTQPFSRGDNRGPNGKIRAPFSERYYALKYREQALDLFVCLPPAQFGVLFAIRTGSWEFSKWLVQQGWPRGLRFENGELLQGVTVTGIGTNGEAAPRPIPVDPATKDWQEPPLEIIRLPCPEEKDVFEFLEIPWLEPSKREGPPKLVKA